MTKSEDQGLAAQSEVSSNSKTQYTDEFRAKVVEVYQSGVYPNAAECAKAYQINENTFYQWINRSRKKSGDPETKNGKEFLDTIRTDIKANATAKTETLINLLNPKIRGWANYYRHGVC